MMSDRKMLTRQTSPASQRLRRVLAVTLAAIAGHAICAPSSAHALPSFARQTGLPCTKCHTNFPTLTPFGRDFKLNGYLKRSGERTGSWQDVFKDVHLAAMAMPSFTHTNAGQPGGAAPGDFGDNDNFAVTQYSLFYGGRLFWKIGAFVQGTYDGVGHQWSIDNTDIRFADVTTLADRSLVYGVTFNNNPTVQDLWNTTPAWGFPFSASGLAPTPAAAALLQGGLSQQVLGIGTYALWDDLVYGEVTAYSTLGKNIQSSLGVDPTGEAQINGLAPYWRLALERTWGAHYLEVGHYGLWAGTYPGRDQSAGRDTTSDIAFDAQYQFFSAQHDVTVLTTFLHENDDWSASHKLGLTDRGTTVLNTFNLTGSYLYDKTYGLTVSFFDITGHRDAAFFANNPTGSPDSYGEIIQLDYLPFNKGGGPAFWPSSSVKLSLQYTLYQRFDGSHSNVDGAGRTASDNNTLYLEAWIAL
jgi:hypothetical protein